MSQTIFRTVAAALALLSEHAIAAQSPPQSIEAIEAAVATAKLSGLGYPQASRIFIHYAGANKVTVCEKSATGASCFDTKMPRFVGDVMYLVQISSSNDYKARWLTFTGGKISLCGQRSKQPVATCAVIGLENFADVEIGYVRKNDIGALTFRSKTQTPEYLAAVADAFFKKFASAEKRLANHSQSMPVEGSESNLEEEPGTGGDSGGGFDGPIVVIPGTPDPGPGAGGGAIPGDIYVPIDNGPSSPQDPPGTAPADFSKARDPANYVKCVADAYSTLMRGYQYCAQRGGTSREITQCYTENQEYYAYTLLPYCRERYF